MSSKEKSNHKTRQRKYKNDKKDSFKISGQAQEIGRLHVIIMDLEKRLQQSQRLNLLYLHQIRSLEEDNLNLCARLQEIKIDHEGRFRKSIEERQQYQQQVQELVKVVEYLQNEMNTIRSENAQLKTQIDICRAQSEIGKTFQLEAGELAAQLQKSKLKLLESEKYWMIKCETLLFDQQSKNQIALLEKDSECSSKLKNLNKELTLREQQVVEKTTQIYKLIQHIQTLPH